MFKKTLGFVILRKVEIEKDNIKWMTCYTSIRKLYPENRIVIVDCSSNTKLINVLFENMVTNTTIIESEYPEAGQLQAYYYYFKNKYFDVAVIISDSFYLKKFVDYINVPDLQFFWDFGHMYDNDININDMLCNLNDRDSLFSVFHQKDLWKGCFKGLSVVTHVFLDLIHEKYNIFNLITYVNNDISRQSFERVLGIVLSTYKLSIDEHNLTDHCIFGDLFLANPWVYDIFSIDTNKHASAFIINY